MKVRLIDDPCFTGESSKLNSNSISEIIIVWDSGEVDSDYASRYEVLLTSGEWITLTEAFRDNKVITDNYNTSFREPLNEEEKKRGWYE